MLMGCFGCIGQLFGPLAFPGGQSASYLEVGGGSYSMVMLVFAFGPLVNNLLIAELFPGPSNMGYGAHFLRVVPIFSIAIYVGQVAV